VYTSSVSARLILHPLAGEKRAGALVQVVEGLYREGRRVVIWVADEGRRQLLDDYLWTFKKLSFLPHAMWQPGMDEPVEPVILAGEPDDAIAAEVLAVGDEIPPAEWAATFSEIHDFVPPGAAGEERTRRWREAGLLPDREG